MIEWELKICLRDWNVLRGVTGDERFAHYVVANVKMNAGCRWRVIECGRKVKVIKAIVGEGRATEDV